jgi:tetratricopeptide (TPR) repeat protein
VHLAEKRYPEALEHLGEALVVYEKALGRHHPDTADSYAALGEAYQQQGSLPQALHSFRTAMTIYEAAGRAATPEAHDVQRRIAGLCSERKHQPACDVLQR